MSYKIKHHGVALCALLLLLCGSLLASPDRDYEKEFSKSYALANDGKVEVINRFGSIRFTSWDRAEVRFDVRVVVEADNQSEADNIFQRIGVEFSRSGGRARAETSVGEGSSNSFFGRLMKGQFFNSSNDDFRIHYEVKLPRTADLTAVAKHCNVEIDDFAGPTDFDVAFGHLVAGELRGKNKVNIAHGEYRIAAFGESSSLRLRHTEGNLGRAGTLAYDGRYSELDLEEVEDIALDVGFDEIEIDRASSVVLDGSYNEVEIGEVGNLKISSAFTDVEVDKVYFKLKASLRYGELSVENLAEGFTSVEVNSSFADVDIDVDDAADFAVDLRASFGDVKVALPGNFVDEEGSNTHQMRGTVGAGGNRRIVGVVKYGDINVH